MPGNRTHVATRALVLQTYVRSIAHPGIISAAPLPGIEPGHQASEACSWSHQDRGEGSPSEELNLDSRVRSTVPGRQDRGVLVGSAAGARAPGRDRRPADRPGVPSGNRTRASWLRARRPHQIVDGNKRGESSRDVAPDGGVPSGSRTRVHGVRDRLPGPASRWGRM